MVTLISNNPEDTFKLGRRLGREARAGQVIGLEGELGAGKTLLTKGIAQGLGITDPIQSPTFALIQEYQGGRFPLHHLDLYRLRDGDEVHQAGLDVYLTEPPGLAVVEWMSRWLGPDPEADPQEWWPAELRRVQMEILDEISRRIRYEDFRH